MGKWQHRLSDVDLDERTAVCAVDGPVRILVSGKVRRCAVAGLGRPAPAHEPRLRPGEHRMLSKDVDARTGVCALCGPVAMVWKKNGYRCANAQIKPEQLKMKTEQKQALRDGKPCEICGNKSQVLDHRHGTKTPRGVLCYKHNTGLGLFSDDPDLLISAARYLQKHE